MRSKGIWNDLELQRNRWTQCTSKAYILTYLKRFSNFRKIIENMYLKHALLRYLKRFGTAGKRWKQGLLRVQYDTFWYDILTFREKIETFETYARRLLGDPIVLSNPPPPFNFITNLDVFFFSFFEMKCRLRRW